VAAAGVDWLLNATALPVVQTDPVANSQQAAIDGAAKMRAARSELR
jgi:hypothetical protein